MSTDTTRGLASVVVLSRNELDFTRQCIRALRQHPRPRWELIVVDTGSSDQTPAYVRCLLDGAGILVTIIANATNRGFPAAINEGLQVTRGEYLALLNKDVEVTDAWLDQSVALANGLWRSCRLDRGNSRACACAPVAPVAPGASTKPVGSGPWWDGGTVRNERVRSYADRAG